MRAYRNTQCSSVSDSKVVKKEQGKEPKKRFRFTLEEDKRLTMLVNQYGNNWDFIASQLEGRNKRQVKERWCSYLSPTLISLPFTPEEDKLLEEKVKESGTKWVSLLKFFPNRTDVALKNRWNMIKRQRSNGGKHQNRKKMTPQSSGPAPILENIIKPVNIGKCVPTSSYIEAEREFHEIETDFICNIFEEAEPQCIWF